MPGKQIVSWRELEIIVGKKAHAIRRYIRLHGFPKPTTIMRPQVKHKNMQSITNVWGRVPVLAWCKANAVLLARKGGRTPIYSRGTK